MFVTSTTSKAGMLPTPILDTIISERLPACLPELTSKDFFIDPVLNLTPGPNFGTDLSRHVLGPLSRYRNLQTRFLQKALPKYTWRFTSPKAFFAFSESVEKLCGRSTLTAISSLELEIDFFDLDNFEAMLSALSSLGYEAINRSNGCCRVGPRYPSLKKLALDFVVIPHGFQDSPGPMFADDKPWLFDFQQIRDAVADIRVATAIVRGLKNPVLAHRMRRDMTGVTEREIVLAAKLRRFRM